ncbi:MAG TPA: DUF5335 family protein [Thermoanaerobaculia bacterium]|jgi:hypothetical protein
MRNRLIPRTEWDRFFEAFSRRHHGRRATVRVFGPKIGSQVEAHELPLEGIVPEARGPAVIDIFLGAAPPRSNIEHRVAEPEQVWVELTDAGSEEALEIRSQDGTQTVVQFEVPRRMAVPITEAEWP